MNLEYATYLSSDDWKSKRNKIIERDKRCLVCGSGENLQVHHGTYDNVFKEKPSQLFTLCGICHMTLHEKYKERTKLRTSLHNFTCSYIRKFSIFPHKTKSNRQRALEDMEFEINIAKSLILNGELKYKKLLKHVLYANGNTKHLKVKEWIKIKRFLEESGELTYKPKKKIKI